MSNTNSQETNDIIRELADEAATAHGGLSPDEVDQLRKWDMEQSLKAKDAATTTLGHVAAERTIQSPMAVHSGYGESNRRA